MKVLYNEFKEQGNKCVCPRKACRLPKAKRQVYHGETNGRPWANDSTIGKSELISPSHINHDVIN